MCLSVSSSFSMFTFFFCFFFFKQKTAYEMRISDWSSDVCSSDLLLEQPRVGGRALQDGAARGQAAEQGHQPAHLLERLVERPHDLVVDPAAVGVERSEEHTSELQSLMRNSYAVFCLQKKKNNTT